MFDQTRVTDTLDLRDSRPVSVKLQPKSCLSITIESSLEHSNEDFKHKKSSAGGKHRKSSESGMKKASTAGAPLQGIPEKDQETGGKRTNGNRVTVNNRTLRLRRTMNKLD